MINLTKRNSVRVFWFSRHDPTPEQLDGLRRYVIRFYPVDYMSVRKVDMTAVDGVQAAEQWQGESVIVAVMPTAMLSEFMEAVEAQAGPAAVAHILLPRSKRERTPDGGVSFVYDGFDRVQKCKFRVEHVG